MKSKVTKTLALVAATALVGMTAGCATTGASDSAVYAAKIQPMNTDVTGEQTTGQVKLVVNDNTLTAHIIVKNAPANIVHWQHFHGFKTGGEATCPTSAADANGDGIVDLIETHPTSGKTMVPFIKNPASMNIAHGTYPKASAQGNYHYQETIQLDKLERVFHKKFNSDLSLGSRVIFIHGVPADSNLPSSVASLGPIPAHVTLPIACAELERVE